MRVNADGWSSTAIHAPSAHFSARPEGESPTLLVVHAISLPPREFGGPHVVNLFQNTLTIDAHPYFTQLENLRVSAHFFIARTGQITQFVSCNNAAWHAGVSRWKGRERCNEYSIGVECEGCDELAFTDAQYAAFATLTQALTDRYPSLVDIAAHSDIAPGRKTDPGERFDWTKVPSAYLRWKSAEPY